MSELVDRVEIEGIVGVPRHPINHYARAVAVDQTVYILHSQHCVASRPDLRECPYSLALDRGIDVGAWVEDEPLRVMVSMGELIPYDAQLSRLDTEGGT